MPRTWVKMGAESLFGAIRGRSQGREPYRHPGSLPDRVGEDAEDRAAHAAPENAASSTSARENCKWPKAIVKQMKILIRNPTIPPKGVEHPSERHVDL